MAVLGILMSAVYGSYRAVADSVVELRPRILLEQKGRFFLQRFSRQIRCCYTAYGVPMDHAGDDTDSEGGQRLFRSRQDSSDETTLEFVTAAGSGKQEMHPGCLMAVAYRWDAPRQALLTRECVYGRRTADDDGKQENWRLLLDGVEDWQMEYFDGTDWQDTWDDAEVSNRLPRAVRVRFTLASERECAVSFSTVVPVLCRKPVGPDRNVREASRRGRQ